MDCARTSEDCACRKQCIGFRFEVIGGEAREWMLASLGAKEGLLLCIRGRADSKAVDPHEV